MIRVAAVGDVHLAPDVAGRHRAGLEGISEHADVLLLAGDHFVSCQPLEMFHKLCCFDR